MDVTALIVAIIAVFVSLAVAGFAIWLQWLMFRASSDQLANIGKENAGLAERLARSLGEIHETTTSTKGAIDRQLEQVTARLLDTAVPSKEPSIDADVRGNGGEPVLTASDWATQRVLSIAKGWPEVQYMLAHMARDDVDKSARGIANHFELFESPGPLDTTSALFSAMGILRAVNAVVFSDDGKFELTESGRRIHEALASREPASD